MTKWYRKLHKQKEHDVKKHPPLVLSYVNNPLLIYY
jgi:hypothetical protein